MRTEVYILENGTVNYADLYSQLQKKLVAERSSSLSAGDVNLSVLAEILERYMIRKKVKAERPLSEIAADMAQDMAGTSVLTKYLDHLDDYPDLEEININAWNFIVLEYADGHHETLEETFLNPQHALDIINKIISRTHGQLINESHPGTDSYITEAVRITAECWPLIPRDAGVYASIRIVRPNSISEPQLLASGEYSPDMLAFLRLCLKYGVSLLIGGKPKAGKTTLLNYLLESIADSARIGTIEEGSREISLQRYGADGRPLRQVLSVLTHPDESAAKNYDTNRLLELDLRYDLDAIVPQEMRSKEAHTAVESALTGAAVYSTIHSNDAESTYPRIVTLMQKTSRQPYEVLLSYAVEAFPIVVYLKQLSDKTRRCMEIMQADGVSHGRAECSTLFRYVVDDNVTDKDGEMDIRGHFERSGCLSARIARILLNNGAPRKLIEPFMEQEV